MNVIDDKKFGVCKNGSTTPAINYSVNRLLSKIAGKNRVIGMFVDLISKAFDTIDHQKHYG